MRAIGKYAGEFILDSRIKVNNKDRDVHKHFETCKKLITLVNSFFLVKIVLLLPNGNQVSKSYGIIGMLSA